MVAKSDGIVAPKSGTWCEVLERCEGAQHAQGYIPIPVEPARVPEACMLRMIGAHINRTKNLCMLCDGRQSYEWERRDGTAVASELKLELQQLCVRHPQRFKVRERSF